MISKGVKSIFPIKNQEIWDRYKLHIQAFWTPEEVSLNDDLRDLQTLNDGEKHFIKHVLAFFANSEAMINENLASRFYKEILIPEARCFISMQMLNESIHAEMYALQIEAYVKDSNEKDTLFDAISNVSCINHKAQWVSKWLNGSQNLLTRLIGFGLVEGLFFAGSFCAIYYFRKRGLLPGLSLSNDWIARDEGMHFSFSALMFKTLRDKFNNGTLGIIDASLNVYRESLGCNLSVFGDKGTVTLGGQHATKILDWSFSDRRDWEEDIILKQDDRPPPTEFGVGHKAVIKNMIYSIENNVEPYFTAESSLYSLELVLAIHKSVKENREIKLGGV